MHIHHKLPMFDYCLRYSVGQVKFYFRRKKYSSVVNMFYSIEVFFNYMEIDLVRPDRLCRFKDNRDDRKKYSLTQ
jgi:hypothetical protein